MTPRFRYKSLLYLLEGTHSLAATYFFTYFLFRLRDRYGFGDGANLGVGAAYGALFTVSAWFGGRLGQSQGFYWALRAGFGGMAVGLAVGWAWDTLVGLTVCATIWTASMCLTWANIEALVSVGESDSDLPNRVGLYNVVWAGTAGVATLAGGRILSALGGPSLFWLPLLVHLAQVAATWPLAARHRRFMRSEAAPAPALGPAAEGDVAEGARFQKLAWTANAVSYMAINTVMVLSPGLTGRLGLDTAAGGALMSWWLHARTAGFALLWLWKGWHYRIGWFAGAYLLLAAALAALLGTNSIPMLVAAQVAMGACVALFYYSSLYYAMDGSQTHGLHGGIHESLVGIGIFGGPAVCVAGAAVAGATGPALGMGVAMAAGAILMVRLGRTKTLRPVSAA